MAERSFALSSLIQRLWHDHIKMYRAYFIGALICMMFAALSTAALPYLLQPVFDDVFANGTRSTLIFFCSAVFLTFVVKGFASFGESVVMNYIGQRIIADIQNRLFAHLLHSDMVFFQKQGTGQLISHFTNDVNLMRNAVSQTLIGVGKDALTLLFLIALMLYRDLALSLATCFIFPLIFYPILRLGKRLRRVSHSTQDHLGSLTGFLAQIFQGIRIVKAYGAEDHECDRARASIHRIFQFLHKASLTRALSHPIVETVGGLAIMGVIAYGGYQVMEGDRTTGEFVSFIGALILSYEPMKRLSNMNANLQEGVAAAKRIYALLDTKPSIQTPSEPLLIEGERLSGRIAFQKVSFAYTPDQPVLRDISFVIEPGQTVAFVGPSGAGKSTLINLIMRFYDVCEGAIVLDGYDVRTCDIQACRHNMALVSQEIVLFNESLAANIAYPEVTFQHDRMQQAIHDAALSDVCDGFTHGWDELLGENGSRLSGGQRQRVSIARAIYRDAPILLLDEATSALDSDSEKHIQTALQHVSKGRTTVIVAHRLSTIMDADVIYVMDQGRIVEQGTHGDLLHQGGLYAQLWRLQTGDNAL